MIVLSKIEKWLLVTHNWPKTALSGAKLWCKRGCCVNDILMFWTGFFSNFAGLLKSQTIRNNGSANYCQLIEALGIMAKSQQQTIFRQSNVVSKIDHPWMLYPKFKND